MPTAAFALSENEMLIFGGGSLKTFKLHTKDIKTKKIYERNKQNLITKVSQGDSDLSSQARFGFESDFVSRQSDKFYCLVDAANL